VYFLKAQWFSDRMKEFLLGGKNRHGLVVILILELIMPPRARLSILGYVFLLIFFERSGVKDERSETQSERREVIIFAIWANHDILCPTKNLHGILRSKMRVCIQKMTYLVY
jgi:hypothetical protein